MNERLKQLIRLKTNGRQNAFAALMGWSPQYLAKLIKSGDFGIKPTLAIVRKFPEINARWLLTGEGNMLTVEDKESLRSKVQQHALAVLDLERFVPVMDADERLMFEKMVTGHLQPCFNNEAKARWIERLHDKKQQTDMFFKNAMDKSDMLCNQ